MIESPKQRLACCIVLGVCRFCSQTVTLLILKATKLCCIQCIQLVVYSLAHARKFFCKSSHAQILIKICPIARNFVNSEGLV